MDIRYHLAQSIEDRKAAAKIVQRQYEQSGYTLTESSVDDKMTLFLSKPTSKTFLGSCGNTPLATVSIIADSPDGLPLDELYQDEIDLLRQKGLRLAEVSQLAIDTTLARELLPEKALKKNALLFPLFNIILQCGQRDALDMLCIAINPKHEPFYDALGFETIGDLKYYASFNQAPAIAKALSLHTLSTASQKSFLYREIALTPVDPRVITGETDFTISL
ncbi:MAG: hypothetical protein WA082_05100 [Candidatus Moraniibacteriota bacterium]